MSHAWIPVMFCSTKWYFARIVFIRLTSEVNRQVGYHLNYCATENKTRIGESIFESVHLYKPSKCNYSLEWIWFSNATYAREEWGWTDSLDDSIEFRTLSEKNYSLGRTDSLMIQTTFQSYLEEMTAIKSWKARVGDYLSSRVDGKCTICIVKQNKTKKYCKTTRATVIFSLVPPCLLCPQWMRQSDRFLRVLNGESDLNYVSNRTELQFTDPEHNSAIPEPAISGQHRLSVSSFLCTSLYYFITFTMQMYLYYEFSRMIYWKTI